MIKINIQILNDNGDELLDKRMTFESLEEMGNAENLAYILMNEAKDNEREDLGTFDTKLEAQLA